MGEALARAGGGQSFGDGVGDDWSSGGGGDGDGGAIFRILIWLLFEHPLLGIPLTVVVVIFWLRNLANRPRHAPAERMVVRVAPWTARVELGALVARDPQFSEVLFLDYARMMFTRVHEERGRGNLVALGALLRPAALATLDRRGSAPTRDVVIGSARVVGLRVAGETAQIRVCFESNLTEDGVQRWVQEHWAFSRRADVASPGPEAFAALRCDQCGSALEVRTDGRCAHCGTPLADGRHLWCVEEISLTRARALTGLGLGQGGGVEAGTDIPTHRAPDLAAQLRALQARHPELTLPAFEARAREIFLRVQDAWAAGDRASLRPLETDAVFQTHRYWLDRYEKEGAANHCVAVEVTGTELARVRLDAWYTSITLRIFATMTDWTVDRSGAVIGGSKTQPRRFSEYWTFVRAAGKPAAPRASLDSCPSCGAPLDKVGESGVCGYCDAKISTGQFDWVLAGIDQDESYGG